MSRFKKKQMTVLTHIKFDARKYTATSTEIGTLSLYTYRGVGTCLRVEGQDQKGGGGQRTGILSKKLYFEVILVKFQQQWGQLPFLFATPLTYVSMW